jgi:hypothetical protein
MSGFVRPNGLDHVKKSRRVVHPPVILHGSAITSGLSDRTKLELTMAKRGAGKSFHSGIKPRSMSWIQWELGAGL